MCKKGCKGCNDCSSGPENSSSQVANQVAELQEQVDTLTQAVQVFMCGHPILLIQNADDVASFGTSGLGINCWTGWAVCNGATHINPITKKPFVTPNFTDRFIVQAGGSYAVEDTGGSNSVTLDLTQIPSHNHPVTDPGHTHTINDPGHIHPITDDMHTHQISTEPHHHDFSVGGGAHTHTYINFDAGDNYKFGDVEIGIEVGPNGTEQNVTGDGTHNHTGVTDDAAVSAASDPAATGIEVENALTGIMGTQSNTTGVTTTNQGGDQSHENRPPYYASLYVIKVF